MPVGHTDEPQQFAHQYFVRLEEACEEYQVTAPTVCEHCDDLFRRMRDDAKQVTFYEVCKVASLWRDGWMHPNYAANTVYKLRSELGMDTTGHAGF